MSDEMPMAINGTAAVSASSTDVSTLLKDAIAAYSDGRADDAERLSRRLLAQQPDHVAGLQIMAALAGQTGRLPLALRLVQKVVSLQPNLVSAHIQLANLLRQEGN
jgi:predicted Zn-dependent protease